MFTNKPKPNANGLLAEAVVAENDLFELAPVSYLVCAADGQITQANACARQMYGLSSDDLSVNIVDLYSQTDPSLGILAWLQGDDQFDFELPFQQGKGIFWHLLSRSRYLEHSFLLIISDISDRKASELSVEEFARQYKTLLDFSPDAILETNSAGNIINANQACAELTEYSLTELQALKIEQLIPLRFRTNHGQLRTEFSKSKQTRAMLRNADRTVCLLTKSGLEIAVEINLSSQQREGRICVVAVIRDLRPKLHFAELARTTKLNWVPSELETRQFSSEANTRSQFLNAISHELRTPTAKLKLMLEELLARSNHSALVAECAYTVDHIIDLIEDLTLGESFDLVKNEFENSVFDLDRTTRNVFESHQNRAKEAGIRFVYSSNISANSLVEGPRKLIRQIINHLLKNALLHSSASRISVRLELQNRADQAPLFTLTVEDDGKGIEPRQQELIFDPYYRGHNHGLGMGLGLHVIKSAVSVLPEGRITLDSELGEGARFTVSFSLPIALVDTTKMRSSDKSESPLAARRVLIVEDTAPLRIMTKSLLERHGATVFAVQDGHEAIMIYQSLTPLDLVLTDIMMPNVDGFELCRWLRNEGFSGPIIGVTAATMGDEPSRLIEAGATAVMAKPLSFETLEKLVVDCFDLP